MTTRIGPSAWDSFNGRRPSRADVVVTSDISDTSLAATPAANDTSIKPPLPTTGGSSEKPPPPSEGEVL